MGTGQDNYSLAKDPNDSGTFVIQRVNDKSGHNEYASLTQRISAQSYIGERIQFSGDLSTNDAGIANLWVRVDGQNEKVISLSNLGASAPKGTTGWQHYSVVFDVPSNGFAVAYGVILRGAGEVKVRNLAIMPVGKEVAASSPLPLLQMSPGATMPHAPVNLGFNQ
jgi:hypothetical protein